jgi:hypothetical protein
MGHNGPAQFDYFSPPSSAFFVPTRLSRSPDLFLSPTSSAIPDYASPQVIANPDYASPQVIAGTAKFAQLF